MDFKNLQGLNEAYFGVYQDCNEEFKDLDPYKKELVSGRHAQLASDILRGKEEVKRLIRKPFAKYRPGIRNKIRNIVNDSKKKYKLAQNASDALIRTSVSNSARLTKNINNLKKLLPHNNIVKFQREDYQSLINHLIYEGYAESYDSAESIVESMIDDLFESLFEGIEIASEYFYSQGLNEDGVDILINVLGEEQFAEFVYDIVEDFNLFEARRSGRIEPITKTGKGIGSLKGGAKAAAIRRLKGEKEKQRASERQSSTSSGMTAALRSQAMKAASSKQKPTSKREEPAQTKQGIGGAVGSVLNYIGRRAREDMASVGQSMRTARQTGREAERRVQDVARLAGMTVNAVREIPDIRRARRKATVAAGRAGRAAGEVAKRVPGAAGAAIGSGFAAHRDRRSPAQIAGRVAGTAVRKMTAKEEVELYNLIIEHLIQEGYTDTVNGAEIIIENMSDGWMESIVEGAY